ncbi:uncharacterized protein ASCRUDRAFT_74130 [Ascoidea rubescens DSM 1968]|uniref:Amino acid permease/ SLC12A domain-containing protein n=1 Tax=Ascoidea rubescens DSM 1968 TaxID=1344418 RepID=A0A1D2VSD4_9ASCO|nr:hypothetical protein ASCRUDRAFT_74130 [Ascoidea rubescens DSM 1968]ODV64523.1 hypothetical protein ASCRUDRAFT_74130 [Ascoidea rubescens DSM 1968]
MTLDNTEDNKLKECEPNCDGLDQNNEPVESTKDSRETFDPKTGVKRALKTRHISMMAVAGIIGPGTIVGFGNALRSGGPVGLIAGFTIVGILVMTMMFSIGELNTMFDFNFNVHASRWVDPAFGATVGWYYVILWICNIIAEYVSLCSICTYFSDRVPIYGWFLIFWFIFTIYQELGVGVFGEAEYILAVIKLLFLTGFYIFAIIFASNGIPNHSTGNPFKNYPLADGFKGIANSFVYAGIFYSGIESISLTTAESQNPQRAIPLAVRQTVFRILYVYYGLSIAYGLTVPYNHEMLSSSNRTMKSPMTIAFMEAGWDKAGYYVSAVVLITCFSSINSAIYIASRSLYNLAYEGCAPKIFKKHDRRGVPYVAIHTVHIFGFLCLLTIDSSASKAYGYIVNLGSVCAFIVWSSIIFSHIRFRKGWLKQGHSLKELPYVAPFYPYGPITGLAIGITLTFVQGWTSFDPFNVGNLIDVYILLPLFPIFIVFYKIYLKSKYIKYDDMNFEGGRKIMFIDEKRPLDKPTGKSKWKRIWREIV